MPLLAAPALAVKIPLPDMGGGGSSSQCRYLLNLLLPVRKTNWGSVGRVQYATRQQHNGLHHT